MKQIPESFSSTKYHVAYHEVHRRLTHGPTLTATGGSRTFIQEVGSYHENHQWSHVPSFRRWATTMRATRGSRTVIQEVCPYHESPQWSHAPSVSRWTPTMISTGGLSSQAETNGVANKAQ